MYVLRSNQNQIYQSFDTPFVTALLGPRRVGKTTLVRQYIAQHPQRGLWISLNMDNREERGRIEGGELKIIIEEMAEQQIAQGEKIGVAIDEAQKCPALFDQVKLLYDQYKDQDVIKFILTGSGFLTLHQLSAESLAGRIELHYLREFGLRETINLRNKKKLPTTSLLSLIGEGHEIKRIEQHIEACAPFRLVIEENLSEQLVWGGLPEVLQESDLNGRRHYLSNYLQTYLEKDIRAITTINDLNLYQRMMEIIADQTGSIRQDKEIIQALGCSRDTLKKYRGFLLATLVYKEIYPFIGSPLRRLVKSPKGYLLNNGLVSDLMGIDELSLLQKTGLIGHRFENWFLKELQIWLDRDLRRSEIYYWRTTGGIEVDFVVSRKPDIFPFEITYSDRIQDRKLKNIKKFLSEQPKATMGFYIYRGGFHYDSKAKICFLPAWAVI